MADRDAFLQDRRDAVVPQVVAIAAVTESNGIGRNGVLPWSIPSDMAAFQRVTSGSGTGRRNAVVMGRKTWESIPRHRRPLTGRTNIVVSRAAADLAHTAQDAVFVPDLTKALEQATLCDTIFIIGGASIYQLAIDLDVVDSIYLTRLHIDQPCDTFFPDFADSFELWFQAEPATDPTTGVVSTFHIFERRRTPWGQPPAC